MSTSLFSLSLAELKQSLKVLSPELKSFNASQIHGHLFKQGLTDISTFSNLSIPARNLLRENFSTLLPTAKKTQISKIDGTRKWLLNFGGKVNAGLFLF
jgi:adenine C2-methylase RlmN of 23S rRNA A2503 and tRNA A37